MKRRYFSKYIVLALVVAILCCACSAAPVQNRVEADDYVEIGDIENFEMNGVAFPEHLYPAETRYTFENMASEKIALTNAPVSTVLMPKADGKTVYSNKTVTIDASNIGDGYIMIKFTGTGKQELRVITTGPSGENYTYRLNNTGKFEVFPLSDGNGAYKIAVYQNVSGTRYSLLLSQNITASLTDEFAPFILPNQYVNYTENSAIVKKAAELTQKSTTELEKVEAVYNFVTANFSYDTSKAQTVQSGYLPDVDKILATKKGICFDYAAVMAAMLRSQNVPTKLVIGYAGTTYHAWLNVYTPETGWVEGVIFFDGKTWKLLDPTFASTGRGSQEIMAFISDGKNYSAKFLY